MRDNVLWLLEGASSDAIAGGTQWYPLARRWCKLQAKQYDVRPVVVAAIISALSPRNKWKTNLEDTITVLESYADGYRHPFNITAHTFRKNVEKAWQVVVEDNPSLVTTSPKTRAFVDNIANPGSKLVTVDVWAMRICEGNLMMKPKTLTEKRYKRYADVYLDVAHEMEMKPSVLQAITWVEARNRAGIDARSAQQQLRLL